MEMKLVSWLQEARGKLDKFVSIRMSKKGVAHLYRRSGKKRKLGAGTKEGNARMAEASRRAKELLKDEEFRRQAEREMEAWNAQFEEGWSKRTLHRGKAEAHPYVSVYHYVVGKEMGTLR